MQTTRVSLIVLSLLAASCTKPDTAEPPRPPPRAANHTQIWTSPVVETASALTLYASAGTLEHAIESEARPFTIENYGVFRLWDADGNDAIDKSEFDRRIAQTTLFGDWDTDGNGEVDEAEFTIAIRTIWDTNRDHALSASEYARGRDRWFPNDLGTVRFSSIDSNGDGSVAFAELDQIRMDLLSIWDVDRNGRLTVQEFGDGIFGSWDLDRDLRVTVDEFNRVMEPERI